MCGCIGNCILARNILPVFEDNWRITSFSSLVSIGAVGIHGQPWPEVSRPVRPQRRSAQSPEPPARGSPRDLAIGIDAGEIDGPVWWVSDRGIAGVSWRPQERSADGEAACARRMRSI